MRERYYTALSAVMYSVCAVLIICLLCADFLLTGLSHAVKIITAVFIFICGFSGSSFLKIKTENNEKCNKITLFTAIVLFVVYILILLDFTLVDTSFGRNISNFFALSFTERADYLKANTNFIPFATVRLFINAYKSGSLSVLAIIENLLGNLVAFMPLAYFLPLLFKRLKKTVPFILSVLIFVAVIEFLQIVFLTGSADIDDLILNTAGAIIIFLFFKKREKV